MKKVVLIIVFLTLIGCTAANKEVSIEQVGLKPEAKPLVVWVYKPQPDITTAELSKIMVLFFRWQNMRGAVDFERELNKAEAEEPKVSIVRHFTKQTSEKK